MLFRVKLRGAYRAYDKVLKQLVSVSSGSSINADVHSKNKVKKIIGQYMNKGREIINLDYTKPETVTNALIDVNRLFLQTLPVLDATNICSNMVKEAKKMVLTTL